MSIKDILGFELFNGKHILKGIGKHPWRAVTGVDPLSTGAWNKVLGRHDDPLVDQMGGAYGGHVISAFGNKDGGVYKDAKAAGIDTKDGGRLQDAAHVIAALIAGNYAMGKLAPTGQGASDNPYSQFSRMGGGSPQQPQQQQEQQAPTVIPMTSGQMQQPLTDPLPPPYVAPQHPYSNPMPPNGLMGLGFRKYYG